MSRSFALALLVAAGAVAAQPHGADPREGLRAGWLDAGEAAYNLELVAHVPKPEGFFNPDDPGDFSRMNGDLAFRGDLLFQGGFHGLQVWSIADPAHPVLRAALPCPGGQGDVSVHGDLMFVSVEETRGRVDCGAQGVEAPASAERFRGVRVYDIADVQHPRQVAAVQTCRGSHTHTLVPDLDDPSHVYLYVSGTSGVRPGEELAGCSGAPPTEDPNTSYFRIEVIEVPLASPEDSRVVNAPRVFADEATGNVAGLWPGGNHGEGTQQTAQTNQCHDITVYPEIGLAAGACGGNGLLLDISDPADPRRIDEVSDPNFAYWHSATFSNDGSQVLFTDEWGGGMAPRCRASDRPEWGADAIFALADGEMTHTGYYKLPSVQSDVENCVAHNGSLIPVPGRDVMAQAWYQGGVSVFDFTDPANPTEIAFFDRGPMDSTRVAMGGYWGTYWYNGYLYASEIGRGLDVFRLVPNEHLSANEIAAAEGAHADTANPQLQTRTTWDASPTLARAYLDQLTRDGGISSSGAARVTAALDGTDRGALAAAARELETAAGRDAAHAAALRRLAGVLAELNTGR